MKNKNKLMKKLLNIILNIIKIIIWPPALFIVLLLRLLTYLFETKLWYGFIRNELIISTHKWYEI